MKYIAFTIGLLSGLCALMPIPAMADGWSSPEYFVVVEDVKWNPATTHVEVKCKKNPTATSYYQFRYNWTLSGHSIDQARFLMSMLMTAQATGRRIDIYGDHTAPGTHWNNFSGVNLVD